MTVPGPVRASKIGGAGRIVLDRPAKLNALTPEMVSEISAYLGAWERDTEVTGVLIDGAGPRGFCAGGDITYVRDSGLAGDGKAEIFWADEYRLDATIAAYAKPIVAFMHGIVMGGGVGLSAHTRHRIVTESTQFAMPEAGIGLIPDVGSTWLFSRAPGEAGTYFALTGARAGAADAIALGFADYFVPQASLEPLKATFLQTAPRTDDHVHCAKRAGSIVWSGACSSSTGWCADCSADTIFTRASGPRSSIRTAARSGSRPS